MDNNSIYQLIISKLLLLVFIMAKTGLINSVIDVSKAESSLVVNGASRHLGEDKFDYNENNEGFGVALEEERDDLVRTIEAGGYENSFGNQSFYVGGKLAKRYGDKVYIDVGGSAGLISGYQKKLQPFVGGVVSVGVKDFVKFNMQYTPKYKEHPAILMMNLGIPFK